MAKRLFILTLEPIDKRYTKQWYQYWKPEFKKSFDVVDYVDGKTITNKIEAGRFLDINQTNMWKAIQIEKISYMFYNKLVEPNDSFLFMDGWHYGITALKYMSQLNNIPIKVFSYWHAGSYDPADFVAQAGLGSWCKYDEIAWFKASSVNFVATKFHKSLILQLMKDNKIKFDSDKIQVVGFPMDWKKAIEDEIGTHQITAKQNVIVFPHRLDKEKNPQAFDTLAKFYSNKDYKFIKTIEVTKNKKEYYELVRRAKISFSASFQETFGIGTVEALMLDCVPLVPRRLSYIEMYDPLFVYTDWRSAKQKIKFFIENYNTDIVQKAIRRNKRKILKQSQDCFKLMSQVMLNTKK